MTSLNSILFATLSGHVPIHIRHSNRDKPMENGRNMHEATLNSVLKYFCWVSVATKPECGIITNQSSVY